METQGHACLRKCNEMRYISHVCYQGLCVTKGYTQTTIIHYLSVHGAYVRSYLGIRISGQMWR